MVILNQGKFRQYSIKQNWQSTWKRILASTYKLCLETMTQELIQQAVNVRSREELENLDYGFINLVPIDEIINNEKEPNDEELDIFNQL